jgi:hypothetical protein
MGLEIAPVCGPMPSTPSGLTEWAACNFNVLVMIVVVAIAVLFVLAMIAIASMVRRRRGY